MIRERLHTIRTEIGRAAERAGRDPGEITLLAVSKRQPAEMIQEAYQCGQQVFGENFVQEAKDKIKRLDCAVTWHFIGRLQSNKARQAARLFNLVETVDRLKIARALSRSACEDNRSLDILVQVNIGMEKQKSGVAPGNVEQLLREVATLPGLKVRGLMGMPPYAPDPEKARPFFRQMKEIADRCRDRELFSDNDAVILSMGMSNDFGIAIEEGATLVRIGTAIFGERPGKTE